LSLPATPSTSTSTTTSIMPSATCYGSTLVTPTRSYSMSTISSTSPSPPTATTSSAVPTHPPTLNPFSALFTVSITLGSCRFFTTMILLYSTSASSMSPRTTSTPRSSSTPAIKHHSPSLSYSSPLPTATPPTATPPITIFATLESTIKKFTDATCL
jgi:hypothetical protein